MLTTISGAWIRVSSGGGLSVGSVTVIIGSISLTRMTISTHSFSTLLIPVLALSHPITPMPMRSFSPIAQFVRIVSVFYTQCRL